MMMKTAAATAVKITDDDSNDNVDADINDGKGTICDNLSPLSANSVL